MTVSREKIKPLTVSIVSHGQWALTRPLLEQLDRFCHAWIEKVVLTLNLPEAIEIDSGWRFAVERIDNRVQQGFGANHNQAFARCATPWFLVCNPDIRLDRDAVGELLALATGHAGLLAPRIQEPGKREPEPYRALLTPWELLRKRLPGWQPPPNPRWVAGMFMLLRAPAYRQVGGFDERFFMYCEDFDLCIRLEQAGWPVLAAHAVVVIHEAQRASHGDRRHLWWHMSSLARTWMSAAFWRALLRPGPPQR